VIIILELNKIHNMSWQEGFNRLEEKIDLIITSPPYNLGGKFHTGNTRYNQAYDVYNDNLPEEIYQEQQRAREFIDIIGNGDLIKEFDIDLYFKMIEKMVVIEGEKIVVSFLDGTDVECVLSLE